ncbi:MAG: efflux RND transporter periplasmic adaptor subunit [bacterium]|nr:efflux RND transporter periplasmic adaptor subunit [bacterium]
MRRATIPALALAIALAFAVAGCSGGEGGDGHAHGEPAATRAEAVAAKWLCPMHPTYVADRKGACPICGMDLVPAAEFAAQQGGGASDVPGMAAIELSDEAVRLAGVRTQPAMVEALGGEIRAVGLVAVDETRVRSVQTRVAGWIETLAVGAVGSRVTRGSPLLTIYSPELVASQQELLRAVAARAAAAGGDPQTLANAESLVASARRRLQLFEVPDGFVAKLEETGAPTRAVPLLSTATGVITERMAYEGLRVEPGMPLFQVTDLSEVWVEARFYENEAGLVAAGAPVEVRLPQDPGVVLTGEIDYVYPTLDDASRTLSARIVLANEFGLLRPGMYANVTLLVDRGEALVVPDDAILDTGERRLVFVSLGGGRFTPREVEVGVRSGGKAQILDGLAAGEQVVVHANFLLDSESRIRAALLGDAAAVPAGGHAEGGR